MNHLLYLKELQLQHYQEFLKNKKKTKIKFEPANDPKVFDNAIIVPAYFGLISNILTQNPLCENAAPQRATVENSKATILFGIKLITTKLNDGKMNAIL